MSGQTWNAGVLRLCTMMECQPGRLVPCGPSHGPWTAARPLGKEAGGWKAKGHLLGAGRCPRRDTQGEQGRTQRGWGLGWASGECGGPDGCPLEKPSQGRGRASRRLWPRLRAHDSATAWLRAAHNILEWRVPWATPGCGEGGWEGLQEFGGHGAGWLASGSPVPKHFRSCPTPEGIIPQPCQASRHREAGLRLLVPVGSCQGEPGQGTPEKGSRHLGLP